jgi:multiple sugar transport system substrate-binding protein
MIDRIPFLFSRQQRYKTYVTFFLACVLCFGLLMLSGCGVRSRSPTAPIELTLWHGINPPPNRDIFQKLVDRFNQTHPTIHVTALYVGQADQQLPKILTAVLGDAPPDILWFSAMITGQLVELGGVHPIGDWLNASPLKADIEPSLLEGMTLDGKIWSVPMAANNVGIFYRPSLFKAAGITQLPQTWEQFRQTAKQLTRDTNGDGKIDRYGMLLPLGKGEWTVFTWLPFLFSAGGELLDGNRPNLVNPEAIAALQLWADLRRDGSAILSAPERGYEINDFLSGRIAMQLTGPWTLGELETARRESGVDYDVMPIPANREQASVVGGENLFVMNTTPEREQASLEFLTYVLSPEFQTSWALSTGYLPISLSAKKSSVYQDFLEEKPTIDVFVKQMSVARSRPIIAKYVRLSDRLGQAIEETLLGHSPEAALKKAQDRLELIW